MPVIDLLLSPSRAATASPDWCCGCALGSLPQYRKVDPLAEYSVKFARLPSDEVLELTGIWYAVHHVGNVETGEAGLRQLF
mmetsp:Transcript_21056/g.62697  ORF Transcript_21056/g.62697 Transcript_21056/m.62697 type:complete len:81 (+) Transcript_21056:32-274(+)